MPGIAGWFAALRLRSCGFGGMFRAWRSQVEAVLRFRPSFRSRLRLVRVVAGVLRAPLGVAATGVGAAIGAASSATAPATSATTAALATIPTIAAIVAVRALVASGFGCLRRRRCFRPRRSRRLLLLRLLLLAVPESDVASDPGAIRCRRVGRRNARAACAPGVDRRGVHHPTQLCPCDRDDHHDRGRDSHGHADRDRGPGCDALRGGRVDPRAAADWTRAA